ncbi:MAG: LemA family protein [Rhodocyclaceae bacterium]
MAAWIFWGVVLAVLAYGVMLYNGLVVLKHAVARAWANIDVLLKQRHDELPKLIEVCRQYRDFESSTLERVIAARNGLASARAHGDVHSLGRAEGELRAGIGQLFAVAESYPELRANEQFVQLQQRVSELEDAISDRRELYNETVNINNARIEQFPAFFIARLCAFEEKPLLRFAAAEKADVNVAALFAR